MHRFPVLVWEDFTGRYSARLVDDEEDPLIPLAGFGRTAREALAQLKEYLIWSFEHEPWRTAPDFLDPQLVEFRVEVRPEYTLKGRVYPSDEPFPLRVACVHGRQESGMLVCALPMIGLQFYYYEAKALRGLVTTYAQESLKHSTPQQLRRYLNPKSVRLEELAVRGGKPAVSTVASPEIENLKLVATPLASDEMRRSFSRAFGRERLVSELVQLLQRERANVLLVGESGVGKTSVLVDAVRIVERDARTSDNSSAQAKPHQFWTSSAARLIAGMKYLGQWEERCERVIEELARIDGVIAFEDLLELVHTGGVTTTSSIASFFQPFLERSEMRIVSETTPAGLDACRRLLPGFVDTFRILRVPDFTQAEALSALHMYCTNIERNSPVRTKGDDRNLIYRLFRRFLPYEAFPGKTVNFTNRLYERAKAERATEITNERIIGAFVKATGLPELFLRDEVALDERDLMAFFEHEVIGQPDACRAATSAVLTFKAGLNDPARPISVLLFTGPTGVGKTELSRSLARFLFGAAEDSERFVRLDMSEYSLPGSAERLIAGPMGEPSEFINQMRRQPFAVVLFDEIEKADEGVFDLLLSMFDEGRLTDRFGRTTYFQSAVIIMTSNLGALVSGTPGFGTGDEIASSTYHRAAQTFFRPEFYNRIDGVLSFSPLSKENVRHIAIKELNALNSREGMVKRNVKLVYTAALVDHVARVGFDSRFGARPLQRVIEREVVTLLALHLNRHPHLRDTQITVDFEVATDRVIVS
ncbi:MAG TPA: AAA family ATPase [Pyrinomonadaceae bacterium]|nr:AAA family ATPase [Pyrinomonadaceae bacterium]